MSWTNAQRIDFNAICQTPVMQEALAELERLCKVTPLALPPGYDGLVLAAAEHHRRAGQAEVLKFIEEMRLERKTAKSLPQPNTTEALAKTPL